MRTRQSPYEIVGDCSDKGVHRHQPLDRFVLQQIIVLLRVGLSQISSQVSVSDLGEWRHICHYFRWQKMWRVTFVIFLGRMWRSRTRKYFFQLVTFFVTSFPENVTFWPRRYKTFLNGKECDDSAGTETCFLLPVSDLSLSSEAWSGKAIWAKTDPNVTFSKFRGRHRKNKVGDLRNFW